MIRLETPLKSEDVNDLKAGDSVEISGTLITARDEAYERILKFLNEGKELPVNFEDSLVYHCGPLVKTMNGWNVVSAGPTTSARLDDLQVDFVENTGVSGLIGKGGLGKDVASEVSSLGCVYLAFTGGAGALAADSIVRVKDVFWKDLGIPESLWVLEVQNFGPLTVGVDLSGGNIYNSK